MKSKPGISRYFVPAIMAVILLITAPATVAFAQRIFPENMLRQITLIAATEAALIGWHAAALFAARGDKQHGVAGAMTWVSLFGAVAMALAEIALEYSEAGIMARPPWLAPVSLLILGVLIFAHLAAGVLFAGWSPEAEAKRADQRAWSAIEEETARQLEDQAPVVARDLAQQRVAARLALMRAQNALAIDSDGEAARVIRVRLPEIDRPAPSVVMAKDGGGEKADTDGAGGDETDPR